MEPSAQIKMCAQTITQFVFYEGNSAKCPFVFNLPNNLDNSNLASFMYFKRLRLKITNVKILCQSLIRGLSWFSSRNATSKLCNMVILKWLDCKSSMWAESNGGTSWSNQPILGRLQKAAFNVLRWKKRFFHNCWINNPILWVHHTNAIMISCLGNRISSFKISPWIAPSHSYLTLLTTMSKTTLVIGWASIAPSMQEL
jgi:hypothetical protein